ncbi:cysteine desulfurase/sulfurtransferase TusA family protein [Fodinibacter luteus]|uniref:Cysteine desulfurase/sulfurtransferase TusA family protein n=1 Tax=Fodinibacter luteus TaxID=552064 RepID=A0ABP8KGP5_9MICO
MARTPSDLPGEGLLDASRGPLDPVAARTLEAAVAVAWADPAHPHPPGRRARALLDTAREVLAAAVGVRPEELSVHASAESALELGLSGLRHARRRVGHRVVAGAAERSVLLLQPGTEPVIPVDAAGRVDVEAYAVALGGGDVAAAVLQAANAEVGTRQPVGTVGARCREAGVPLLLDATASVGRDWSAVTRFGEDASVLVADAAAFGGPPLGLLAVRAGTRWGLPGPRRTAEQGREHASPWVPLVLAAAEAWQQAAAAQDAEERAARDLVDRVRRAAAAVPDVEVVGDPDDRLPHVVTFSVLFADGEVLLEELARRGLVVASGSACTSSALRPSHVLAAMGVLTHGNVRVTLPLGSVSPTRGRDVARLCQELPDAVAAVRRRLGTGEL